MSVPVRPQRAREVFQWGSHERGAANAAGTTVSSAADAPGSADAQPSNKHEGPIGSQ